MCRAGIYGFDKGLAHVLLIHVPSSACLGPASRSARREVLRCQRTEPKRARRNPCPIVRLVAQKWFQSEGSKAGAREPRHPNHDVGGTSKLLGVGLRDFLNQVEAQIETHFASFVHLMSSHWSTPEHNETRTLFLQYAVLHCNLPFLEARRPRVASIRKQCIESIVFLELLIL